MNKAFVFPGQGAQYAGMGKDFYDNYKSAREIFDKADEALGFSISKLCFEGPEEELKLTFNTQPAILTVSIAAFSVLKEKGIMPEMAAGHSLGEYSALVAAGAMDFSDAVRIVRQRGSFMQEAVPAGEGAMAAVMGMTDEAIIKICQSVEKEGEVVQAVNFNCPNQVVIAGKTESVEKAIVKLKENGAKRAVLLPVSAPFHSTLMKPAALKLKEALDKITINDAQIPVFSNVTAQPETKAAEIKELLVKQADNPVLWTNLAKNMAGKGADIFIEVGPGKTLTGFAKKITPDKEALNVFDIESLDKTISQLKELM